MEINNGILKRSYMLLGDDTMHTLASLRVIVFGVGGVGSWCAESLVRSGVAHLTIVDSDRVCHQYQPTGHGHYKDRRTGKGGGSQRAPS